MCCRVLSIILFLAILSNSLKLPVVRKPTLTDHLFSYKFHFRLTPESLGKGTSKWISRLLSGLVFFPALWTTGPVYGDDELARYAAEGNKVGVDATCFFRKCAIETADCANDPTCLKGLSCLARCKGGSMCSTGCFAKYGGPKLDGILHCSVEKHDCVQVPGKEVIGWRADTIDDLPSKPLQQFEISSLKGKWYKVMGLDSRYDCFDCQKNTFEVKKDQQSLKMEAIFRIPRPAAPGYLQTRINEELHPGQQQSSSAVVAEIRSITPHLQSKGEMFGLTFWENWYVLAESKPAPASSLGNLGVQLVSAVSPQSDQNAERSQQSEMKLIYYTGHTLQGSYKGAFLYSRSREMTPGMMTAARELIASTGLNPNDFCMIRNQCFSSADTDRASFSLLSPPALITSNGDDNTLMREFQIKFPFWYLGQKFFYVTKTMAKELADWFEDPAMVSDWLVKQQERMVFTQPLEVSPFAALGE